MAAEINHGFFEDNEAKIFFFYSGKKSVLGLQYPDSSILNDKNYKYTRIGIITCDLPDSTSETCVDETLTIAIENASSVSNSYENSNVNRVHIFGVIKGNSIVKTSFRCICEPIFNDSEILEIYLTEENTIVDGLSTYCLGIWVKTENCNKIFVNSDNSHSINAVPMDEYCFSSSYELSLLKEENKEADVDTTDLDSYIQASAFCTGTNIYESILGRITALENRNSYNFCYATVSYDVGFTPIATGNDALLDQVINPSNISYGLNISPFLTLNTADQYFTVKESGVYLLQLNAKFSGSSSKIKITISNNNDVVSDIVYDPSYEISTLSIPLTVLNLQETNLIRVKFTFIDSTVNDIVNEGTNMTVIRLL